MMNMVWKRVALRFVRGDVMAELRWGRATRREACGCMPDHGRIGIAHVLARLASFTVAIVVAASLSGAVSADSSTEQPAAKSGASDGYHTEYEVVWGEKKAMCEHMAALATEYQDKQGNLNNRIRERFESLKWLPVTWVFVGEPTPPYSGEAFIASFDINNDGSSEWVLRTQTEWIPHVYPRTETLRGDQLVIIDQDDFGATKGAYSFSQDQFRAFPKVDINPTKWEDFRAANLSEEIRSRRALPAQLFNPRVFVTSFEKRTYLLLQDYLSQTASRRRDYIVNQDIHWILVATFSNEQATTSLAGATSQLQHQCYLSPIIIHQKN